MTLRTTYANLPDGFANLSLFDQSFTDVGNLGVIPCTATGTNAILLTPAASAAAPTVTTPQNGQLFSFVAQNVPTGLVTVQLGSITKNLYVQDAVTQANAGDLQLTTTYIIAYNTSLNSGAGGFQIVAPQTSSITRTAGAYTATPTVYTYVSNLAGHLVNFNNAAGYQQFFNTDSGGRTQVSPYYTVANHIGYGDMVAYSATMGIQKHSSWAGVTYWSGRNSITLSGGASGANSDTVNLYGSEYVLQDNGFQSVAALGHVYNLSRTATNAASYTTPWLGVRVQSLGSQPVNSAFQAVSLTASSTYTAGLDLTGAAFTASNAAITLSPGQRIYLNADATGPTAAASSSIFAGDTGTSLNNDFINYTSVNGVNTINTVVGNNVSMGVTSSSILLNYGNLTNDALPFSINFRKQRLGGTTVQVNDALGFFGFAGLTTDGSYHTGAYIQAVASTVSASAVGAVLQFVSGASLTTLNGPDLTVPGAVNSNSLAITNGITAGTTVAATGAVSGSAVTANSGNVTATSGNIVATAGNVSAAGSILSSGSAGVGYATGAGGTVTQITSRTTGVTLNKIAGAITLFTAAPTVGTWVSFTVTNSTVAATDTVVISVKSGTNTYVANVSAVAAGSFQITFQSVAGTASDAPVINFAVIKAVTA